MSATDTILAIDQGTTSSRAVLIDRSGEVLASAQREFPQYFPQPGWVEHDPEDIWGSVQDVVAQVLLRADELNRPPVALGMTNQRETTLIWDRLTGEPLHRAIVWQDRRTTPVTETLRADGKAARIEALSGLVVDPYFSATKIAWILDHVDGGRERAKRGELCFGTVDSFLIWRLTGGKRHITDVTNASRTSLLDLASGVWSDELCETFNVPVQILPEVAGCTGLFGVSSLEAIGRELPITGLAGDQQAALIGQGGFAPGDVKCTFGTGAFLVANTGGDLVRSRHGLLSTIAYQIDETIAYAQEGAIMTAGAAMQWLRDGLGILDDVSQSADLAASVPDNGGVFMVPAFAGLGAPYWSPDARGSLTGLTRGTTRAHIVRAALEANAHQTADLLDAMAADGLTLAKLKIDGGLAMNDWFAQHLADISRLEVIRPANAETTVLGAARLAAIGAGLTTLEDSSGFGASDYAHFHPNMAEDESKRLRASWANAVSAALHHAGGNAD